MSVAAWRSAWQTLWQSVWLASAGNILDFATLTPAALASSFGWVRTGAGTMEESDGDLVYGAHNLLAQSENFVDAAWTKSAINVGLLGSELLAGDGTNSFHFLTQGASYSGGLATGYAVLQQNTARYAFVQVRNGSNGASVIADLQAGPLSSPSNDGTGTGASATITAVQDGYAVTLSVTIPGLTYAEVRIGITNSPSVIASFATTDSVYIKKAQQNQGALTDCVPTTTSPVFLMRAPDYTHGVPGLLLEGQRTNLLEKTTDLSHGKWTFNPGAAPIGSGSTSSTIRENVGLHLRFGAFYTLGGGAGAGSYSLAVAVSRLAGSRFVRVILNAADSNIFAAVDVNPSTGAVVQNLVSGGVTMLSYRCELVGSECRIKFSVSGISPLYWTVTPITGAAVPAGTDLGYEAFVGDGVGVLQVEDWQLEPGAYPTSHIPNPGTGTVTRAADVAPITGTAFSDIWAGIVASGEFTLVLDVVAIGAGPMLILSNGTYGAYLSIDANNFSVTASGNSGTVAVGSGAPYPGGSFVSGVRIKTAISVKAGQIEIAANGALGSSGAMSTPIANFTQLAFYATAPNDSTITTAAVLVSLSYSPTAKTGAALQALTA